MTQYLIKLALSALIITVVSEVPKRVLLTGLLKVFRGAHLNHPGVMSMRTRRAEITTGREAAIYGDGEPMAFAGAKPTSIVVLPKALRIVY